MPKKTNDSVHTLAQHYCSYLELAYIVEATTKVGLGGGDTDWKAKADIVEKALRYLAKGKRIYIKGQRHSLASAFSPRLSKCCLDATGLIVKAIGRRPILGSKFEREVFDELVAARAALPASLATVDNSLGSKYWKQPRQAPQGVNNAWHAHLQLTTMDKLESEYRRRNPKKVRASNRCFFGCKLAGTRKQDFTHQWRGAKAYEWLCTTCYKSMDRESTLLPITWPYADSLQLEQELKELSLCKSSTILPSANHVCHSTTRPTEFREASAVGPAFRKSIHALCQHCSVSLIIIRISGDHPPQQATIKRRMYRHKARRDHVDSLLRFLGVGANDETAILNELGQLATAQ